MIFIHAIDNVFYVTENKSDIQKSDRLIPVYVHVFMYLCIYFFRTH